MLKNKKIYFILLIFILILIGVYGMNNKTRSKGNIVDILPTEVSVIKIFNGNNGKEINISEKEDIEKIIKNLNQINFEKDRKVDTDGFSVSMVIYDLEGNENKSLTINSTDTIIYNDYFYIDKNDSIDHDFIKSLFEK